MSGTYILYDSRFNDGTPTATNTATGYSVLNIKDYRSYTLWKATGSGTLYLTVDCSTAKAADTLGIFYHNLGTAAASVSVECSSDNFAADTTVALAGFNPSNDYAILKTFSSVTKRYWRLKIVTAAVTPQLAICLIGERITFPSGPLAPLNKYTIGIESEIEHSKAGHILGTVVRYHPVKLSYVFPPSESNYTWWSVTFKAFWNNHGKLLKPFFFCLDYGNFPDDIFWVNLTKDMQYILNMILGNRVETFTLNMEGVAE
jgi:hypothetical protein